MPAAGATAPPVAREPLLAFLESRLGLSFSGPRRARLVAAIETQRASTGMSEDDFLDAVSRPGRAFDRLVTEVTVGETSFFRDRMQCQLLREVVLPDLAAQLPGDAPVHVWSAGCATGEEPLTVAALAEQAGLGDRCAVVGTDVSARALDKARAGRYGRWSLRSATADERAAYFTEEDGGYVVAERLLARTRFVQRNLLDGAPPPGSFSLVLCRNVLIYLTREAIRRVADLLADALSPTGWLLIAAGDPPLPSPALVTVRTPYGVVYRRRPASAALPPATTLDERRERPGRRHRALSEAGPARTARTTAPPPAQAQRPARAPAEPTPTPTPATAAPTAGGGTDPAARIRGLGDAGRLDEACRVASEALRDQPLDVELHYLAGVVLLEAGRLDEAAAAAASAVYLGGDLPAAHLLLGQVEHARGNTDRARRSFRNGSRLLAALPDDAPMALAPDVPPRHLAAVAARYLEASGSAT
jgi:chemotaxis protein methyltransferase CheR